MKFGWLLCFAWALVVGAVVEVQAQTPALHPASEFADPMLERLPPPESVLPELIPPGSDVFGRRFTAPEPLTAPFAPPVIVDENVGMFQIWSGSFELGVNGADGNSQAFNIRAGSKVTRKARFSALTIDALYRKDSSASEVTANRLYFDARQEWPLKNTPWTVFGHNLTELDEFQAWQQRVTVDIGMGYQFIKTDLTKLIGRYSSGASREFGGPTDDVIPQGLVGIEYQHQITYRQSAGMTVDYFYDWAHIEQFRLNGKLEWTILLDEPSNLSVKFSVLNRHDSNPDGKKPNDLDYAALLLWKF